MTSVYVKLIHIICLLAQQAQFYVGLVKSNTWHEQASGRSEWLSGKWTHVRNCARCEDPFGGGGCSLSWLAGMLRYQERQGKHSRSVLKPQTHWPSMKRERGLISDCTYNWKEEAERWGGGGGTNTAHSWRMRTMSLFSLNRIYKPNRHTPMPLTQTHTFSFSSLSLPLSLCVCLTNTDTQLRQALWGFHQQ